MLSHSLVVPELFGAKPTKFPKMTLYEEFSDNLHWIFYYYKLSSRRTPYGSALINTLPGKNVRSHPVLANLPHWKVCGLQNPVTQMRDISLGDWLSDEPLRIIILAIAVVKEFDSRSFIPGWRIKIEIPLGSGLFHDPFRLLVGSKCFRSYLFIFVWTNNNKRTVYYTNANTFLLNDLI